MDISLIAKNTGLTPRSLHYAIYHTVLPGVSRVHLGRGAPRSFTEFEAFGIALAATLLTSGVKRKLVAMSMVALLEASGNPSSVPMLLAFNAGAHAVMTIADGRFVRLTVAGHGKSGCDTGWLALSKNKLPGADFEPQVATIVNLAKLRRAVRGR